MREGQDPTISVSRGLWGRSISARPWCSPSANAWRRLTSGRYGPIAIGPQLEAAGIQTAGAERKFDVLSVDTQEQFALLLRLSIAEALEAFIVLDDQLTQSDPERMTWMRGSARSGGLPHTFESRVSARIDDRDAKLIGRVEALSSQVKANRESISRRHASAPCCSDCSPRQR